MKPKNLCLVAAIVALSLFTGLLTSSSTAHAQVLPTVPHYTCYDLLPTGPPPSLPPMVTLQTQFGVEDVDLLPMPARLCLPTLKNGEGSLLDPHVECLPIIGESPVKIVNLTTQFGIQKNVEVGAPISMCMPATKAIYPEQPQQPPPLVPHYECYNIHGPSPIPPGLMVSLKNQFVTLPGGLPVEVGPPTRLCLPALKNGEGSLQVPHVECFQILANPPEPPKQVNLWTQFGIQLPWVVGPAVELCVPALKTVVNTSIGGIAEDPGADASALEATTSGGSSGTTYAVIASIAAGLVVLGAGGWYARRRWLS